jgi:hypothetical protein
MKSTAMSINKHIDLAFFFKRHEYNRANENWYDLYDNRWIILMDAFRLKTGPCTLSPNERALGRRDGVNNRTGFDAHNIDKHGIVMGGDIFPHWQVSHSEYVSALMAVSYAKEVGFTGIGLYPEWILHGERRYGLHLDTRRTHQPGEPAEWGYVDGEFVHIKQALKILQTENEDI